MNSGIDIQDLRNRIKIIRRKKLLSLINMAKEIGVDVGTLDGFLTGEKDTAYKVVCLIEDYVIENEKDKNVLESQ